MPPKGWRKNKEAPESKYMEVPRWRKEVVPFGHRLNFLSPEAQHLNTGRLRILPAKNPERRERNSG